MFTILKNRKGVTLLEGMIAMLILAVVTVGTFGVVLSSTRNASQPNFREDSILALEQIHNFAQALSPLRDEYRENLWDSEEGGEHSVYLRSKGFVFGKNYTGISSLSDLEKEYGKDKDYAGFADNNKWKILLTDGDDLRSSYSHALDALNDDAFLPSLCDPSKSSVQVEQLAGSELVASLYQDSPGDMMRDQDIKSIVDDLRYNVFKNQYTVDCQGYGI